MARRRRVLTCVDTMQGNVKCAIQGTCQAMAAKHLLRYLAQFSYWLYRRYDLAGMLRTARRFTDPAHPITVREAG